jgi:hypothetical protein
MRQGSAGVKTFRQRNRQGRLQQSCGLVGVPTFEYLKDVLIRATHPH